ncbi:MAG: recombinase family protein [Nitrospirota bacterium]
MDAAKPKRAVIYARVSTEQQRERHTIASQLSVMPGIVRQHGYELVDEPYVDDGVSGETINERPGMLRLLDDAERDLFDAIFVIDLDRMTRARKSIDWEIIKDICRRHCIYVITPSQVYDFANEDHEFISDIFSRLSALEKRKFLRRAMRGKLEKVRQGRFIGGRRPYGYQIVEGRFEIREEEAAVVREIFQRCLNGESCEIIPHALTAAGYLTPLGQRTPWSKSSVVRILHDSKYAGAFVRWKWKREDPGIGRRGAIGRLAPRPLSEQVTVEVPAIVTKETFEAAQLALNSRKTLSSRNTKREYLLGGILWCASCGCRMTGECYANEQRYYVCWNRRRKISRLAPCPVPACRADWVEEAVWKAVTSLLSQPDVLHQAIQRANHGTDAAQGDGVRDPRRIERLLEMRRKEKARLINLYMIGAIDEEVHPQLLKLKTEMKTLEEQLTVAWSDQRRLARVKSINTVWMASLQKRACETLTFPDKRTLLKLLFLNPDPRDKSPQIGIWYHQDHSIELIGIIDLLRMKARGYGIESQSCS